MRRAWTISFLLLACTLGKTPARLPLLFSFGHHSASALPVYGALSFPLNPVLRMGTEWGYGRGRHWEERSCGLLQGLDLAAFRNPFHGSGLAATTQGMLRGNTRWGLFYGLSLDAGYLLLFHPRETFKSNGDGTFRRTNDWGRSSALFGPGLHAGFRTLRLGSIRLYPRLEYAYRIQYPYNDLIPIFPHNILHMGFSLGWAGKHDGGKDE